MNAIWRLPKILPRRIDVQKFESESSLKEGHKSGLHFHGSHIHCHAHDGAPSHGHSHSHDHDVAVVGQTSRRDFLRVLTGSALVGASILELAYHRAAWARAAAPSSDTSLFNLQMVANGVYFAQARPQTIINCNAAVFVRSKDVVVVDAHSKPSAAASLIAQIKREITEKPVRYVINTHFHWDHTQGNHAYRMTGEKVDFISTAATKQLMSDLAVARMKASLDAVPQQIDTMRTKAAHSKSNSEKTFYAEQIRQLQAYQADLKDYTLELPTIAFDKSYLLHDPEFDLHLEFHGHAHTAGDVFVFCPQQRALATGDAVHGWFPFIADGYPRIWPRTIDEIGRADFKYVLGGHGPLQSDRTVMVNQRNYIEELTGKVEQGKRDGLTVDEMQKRLTVASLRSLQSNGYEASLTRAIAAGHPSLGETPQLQNEVNTNISDIFKNLDRV
jgi:glyoxylase-like metal-dependent hydrolase (beta-lactamase superfamily II)